MKKIFKKEVIIAFIVGIILASSIAVYAVVINASEVDYKDGKKVSQALDELYNKSKNYKKLDTTTTASSNDILNGKTAYDNLGNLITGTYNNKISLSLFNNTEMAQFELTQSLVNIYPKIKITGTHIYSGNTCTYGICKTDGSSETAFNQNQEYNIQSLYNSGYTKLYIHSNGWGSVTYELYN